MKAILKQILPQSLQEMVRDGLSRVGERMEQVPPQAKIFAEPGKQIFFGYYDVTPFSGDDMLLLAQQAPAQNISPHKAHPDLALGYYDLREKKPQFHRFAATKTWNWQQGCRLQWYPSQQKDTRLVIYNTLVDGQFGAVIQNALTGEIQKTILRPVYAVSPDGSFALSLDFARLHRYRRGYGYSNLPGGQEENVIRHINLLAGAERTIMDIGEAAAFRPEKSMQGAQHYFNHLSISPSGKRFMVMHLWLTAERKRYSRILAGSLEGGKLACPDSSGIASHYCWAGDDCIIISAPDEEGAMRYHLHDLDTGARRIFGASLKQDGHPSWRAPGWMITDTYPDLFRLQHLLRYSEEEGVREIARFHTPPGFSGEVRCDLHPRLDHSGRRVCVDIVRGGRRAMCVTGVS